jgi:hypothetical protein
MIKPECPLCGTDSTRRVYRPGNNPVRISKCKRCEFVFCFPPPLLPPPYRRGRTQL